MKNLSSSYINHPEAFYIFIFLLIFFMLAFPCAKLIMAKIKLKKFTNIVLIFNPTDNFYNFSNLPCNFCKSFVKIRETIMSVPEEVKFRIFFIKESGYKKLNLCRCANCNTKLFYYIENSRTTL